MTTSPLPWHLDCKSDGFTYIKDFCGNQVAQFANMHDAQFFMDNITASKELDILEDENANLENRIEVYKKTIEQLENIIEKINKT